MRILHRSIATARTAGRTPRIFVLAASLVVLLPAQPAPALECAATGAIPPTLPDDTNDSSATACGDGAVAGHLHAMVPGDHDVLAYLGNHLKAAGFQVRIGI